MKEESSVLPAQADPARGRHRWKMAGLTGATSALYQILVMGTGLASVPLTVGYLGGERYGVWLTLSSLLMWLSVSDMGFAGNALINALAEGTGRDDKKWQQELTATAFWVLAAISVGFGAVMASVFWVVPWPRVFNVSSPLAASELAPAIAISFAAFVVEFPARVAVGVYHGNQEGYLSNTWNILGSLLSLLALIWVTRHAGGLPALALALWGTRLTVSVAAAAYLFIRHRPWLMPTPRAVTRRAFDRLGSLGLRYLLVQAGGIAMTQSQPLVIAQMAGPAAVAIFSVTQRVALLPQSFVLMFLSSLMPAYAEARARRDWSWIRRTFRRTAVLGAAACLVAGLVTTLALPRVISLWLGPQMTPPFSLVMALGLYVVIGGLLGPASVMLYGMERVGRQAMIGFANGVLVIALGAVATHLWGVTGMGVAMVVAALLTNLPGQLLEARAVLNQCRRDGAIST